MLTFVLRNVKIAFLFAFVIGGGVILSAPYFGADHQIQYRVGIPVGIATTLMVLYGVLIWMRSRTPYASDADADSLYYLGFIFTLISLTSQLIPQMFPALRSGTPQLAGNELLGIFGLGLLTTFLGLAGRILFQSFAAEPAEELEASLTRLSATFDRVGNDIEFRARRTSDGLDEFGRAMQAMGDEMRQALSVSTENTLNEIMRIHDEVRQSNVDSIAKIGAAIETVLADASVRLQGMSVALTQATNGIATSSKNLAATTIVAAKSLAEVTSQLAATSSKLQSVAGSATTDAETSQRRILSLGAQFESAQRNLAESISGLGSQGALLDKQLAALSSSAQILAANFGSVSSTEPGLVSAFNTLQKGISETTVVAEKQLGIIKNHQQGLEESLVASRLALTKVHRELVDSVGHIKRELG